MDKKDLRLKDMAKMVDDYIGQFEEGYFSPLALLASLSEEVGELAKEVNHYYGEKPKRKDEEKNTVDMELSDCLFIILCFANALDIDLEEAFLKMMDKFNERDHDRWTRKE
ncbi:nucleotide pyrophosphohydrolase [Serpentinicella sp. ANB-PHB4]|uniref:nucleotide pyrophosphohydrolase n=1 Tax=Serpentinicella sp. ANB-PHB4 TaxID=3074076 RepID=UPI0028562E1A|nr:nucleotide pyrophosphohydrolase [Serpentinicella sp. ANB-PHB4]MDR5659484.1 nucleotide pyrophosphohydrolase [Serpentinicella sp. ANB-PHB4]